MFEIIMLLAFFYAAICQLLPETTEGNKSDSLGKKCRRGKARERSERTVKKQTGRHMSAVRSTTRQPVMHVRHNRLRQVPECARATRVTVLSGCF
jgi:hypothetical protein